MKTKLLYLMLFVTAIAGAQIVDIPDANFKAKLLAASTSVDIARNSTGQNIVIDTNEDGEIQESEALAVYELRVSRSSITNFEGIESFTNLTSLYCNDNSFSSLSFGLTNLQLLNASANGLNTLDVSGCTNLVTLYCDENRLVSLYIVGLTNLRELWCGGSLLTSIDLTGVNLETLYCQANNFTTLDLSSQTNLSLLLAGYNSSLQNVYLKNGSNQPVVSATFSACYNLEFICTDATEFDAIINSMANWGVDLTDLQLTSFCTFTPGGDYNTITGNATFDFNGDGCDVTDANNSLIKVKMENGTDIWYTFTNNEGQYTFYTQAGTFEVSPQFEDNQYFIASPQAVTVNFPVVDNSIATENFCIVANGIHPDVEVVMVPIGSARPGFDANYKIVFKNKGNQTVSGTVSCLWDYGILEPVSITPMANDIQPGAYTWNYTNLQPFENREILMTLNVNSPTESPAVNSGDILPFTASITHAGTDETPQDNQYVFNQTVVNSFDPNNIICIEGDTEPTSQIGEYLHYVVNFENTGTAAADFVVIRHDIDPAEFDINTLEILNASHNVRATVTDNTIEFAFREINLQASFHGNILFKLKSRPNLHEGSTVGNQANIYFDYNHPIETNEANTVFATLSRGEFNVDASVKLYPNPATGIVNVEAKGNITSIQLYDVQGRLLQVANNTAKFDISSRAKGMYFVKVTTDNGVKVEKLIKQ